MNLIIDRNLFDVERWKILRDKGWVGMTSDERSEWLGELPTTPNASKGMYTHNDLNRVESAVEVIVGRLIEAGFLTRPLVVKTDWSYGDVLTKEDMSRYLSNIATLRTKAVVYPNTPIAPNVNRTFNYNAANDIEKILSDIDDWLNHKSESSTYVGDIFLGEV